PPLMSCTALCPTRLFFLVAAPAAPQADTLPLHDALPISYEVDGTTYQVPITEPGRGTALHGLACWQRWTVVEHEAARAALELHLDRKSTRLNSSHVKISYAVFCLKKKKSHKAPRHREPRS